MFVRVVESCEKNKILLSKEWDTRLNRAGNWVDNVERIMPGIG